MKQTNNGSRETASRGGRTPTMLALAGFMLLASVFVVGLTAYALLAPQRGAPAEPALTWHREGGLAGLCEEVAVYATGDANLYSCQGERPVEIGQARLDEQQIAALGRWMDMLQPFEYEQDDTGTADGMAVRLSFSGTGKKAAEEMDRQLLMDLVQALYDKGWILAGDASTVCPAPGTGQQLFLDREAGYCLLYPAEYTPVRTEPGVIDLVIGSVLNHVDPRLSITVEDAEGRSLEDVTAQMVADFVPAGWELTREAITVNGVEAVVLDDLPGQDLNRRVAFLQSGRLYTLFLAPIGDEGSETRQQAEMLYGQVLDSFRFLKAAASTPPPATDLDGVEPIHFASGNSSTTMSGSVTAQAAKRYVLSALGGQTLGVELDTSSLQAYITVLAPEGGNMAGADGPIHQWADRLPVDGDYVVEVINPGHTVADFELTVTLSEATDVGSGDGSEPVEVLVQLDWEGGFTPAEVAVPFGRVPAFTLLADGRVLYLDWDDTAEVFQEKLLIAQLRQDETEALLEMVLDMGFAGLESHLDFCMALDDGTSQCVADAGYSILRVRLPEGDLREIRNWAGFANDPEALAAILDLLSTYRHPEAVPFVPAKASLFIRPISSVEGVQADGWPLNPGWLTPPAPDVEQWAGVLAGEEWDVLLLGSSWNTWTHYYRYAEQFYQVVLVPWLPGTDYTAAVKAYRSP